MVRMLLPHPRPSTIHPPSTALTSAAPLLSGADAAHADKAEGSVRRRSPPRQVGDDGVDGGVLQRFAHRAAHHPRGGRQGEPAQLGRRHRAHARLGHRPRRSRARTHRARRRPQRDRQRRLRRSDCGGDRRIRRGVCQQLQPSRPSRPFPHLHNTSTPPFTPPFTPLFTGVPTPRRQRSGRERDGGQRRLPAHDRRAHRRRRRRSDPARCRRDRRRAGEAVGGVCAGDCRVARSGRRNA